ncbi:MAG TPA: MFS transporter [Chitinophagaceae bacterium]
MIIDKTKSTIRDFRKWKVYNYRWRIVLLLFFATTINYLDRSVLSILAPALQKQYKWSEVEYGYIVTTFQMAYGLGVVFAGKLLDKYGTRIIMAFAIVIWSTAGILHALASTAISFAIARFFLGLGESANFPAAIKTVAEWFPKKERALATGIFNSGSNIGAIVSPLLCPLIAIYFGWQWAFVITGMLGFIWLIFWLKMYSIPAENNKVTPEEIRHIHSDNDEVNETISWTQVVFRKETLVICLARFLTDPVWWFFLYWLPKFLDKQYHISLMQMGLPLIVIYLCADLGGIAGGWISSSLMKKGVNLNKARKIALLICALGVVPVIYVSHVSDLWIAVALISLATASHCGWIANVFTLTSDIFPKNAVGTVVGVSTFAAVVGGMLFSTLVGFLLEYTGSYILVFSIAGCAYFTAWVIIQIGMPKIKPIQFKKNKDEKISKAYRKGKASL